VSLPSNVRITEAEMVALVKMSDREHPLMTTWGIGDAKLLPEEANRWAFEALVEMRK